MEECPSKLSYNLGSGGSDSEDEERPARELPASEPSPAAENRELQHSL